MVEGQYNTSPPSGLVSGRRESAFRRRAACGGQDGHETQRYRKRAATTSGMQPGPLMPPEAGARPYWACPVGMRSGHL